MRERIAEEKKKRRSGEKSHFRPLSSESKTPKDDRGEKERGMEATTSGVF